MANEKAPVFIGQEAVTKVAEQVADKQEVFFPAYDPEKSPQENARIRKEYMEKCKNA